MTPGDTFTAWRAELVTERENLESLLAAATTAFDAAELALQTAKAECAELLAYATSPLQPGEAIESPLRRRLLDANNPQTKASGARARAAATVAAIRAELASVRASITQIDRALRGEQIGAMHRPEVIPQRQAPIIDFDNIVPAGATS
jgi:hypothetical protein